MLEQLDGESARERFREVMLSPPIYPDDMVDQAVCEFEQRIHKIKISESIRKAKKEGDIETLNKLIKLKNNNGTPN